MTRHAQAKADVKAYDRVKEYWKENKLLGGLIKWQQLVRSDTIATELHISAPLKDWDKVYLNGVEMTPKRKVKKAGK